MQPAARRHQPNLEEKGTDTYATAYNEPSYTVSAPAVAAADPLAPLREAETFILTAQSRAADEYTPRLDWLDRDLIVRDLAAALELIAEARELIDGRA